MASKIWLKWVLIIFVLSGCLLVSLIFYSFFLQPLPTFLTTASPAGTYTVLLNGQKSRPIFFTATIRFDVLKNGTRMLSDKFLYSADGMDIPFETWYPDHRWLNEQSIQFYRDQNFRDAPSDTIVVANNTGKTVKYAKIDSIDIVMFFEMQDGFKVSIPASQSKGESKWLSVKGEFSDGTNLSEFGADFVKNSREPKTFYVDLRPGRTTVDMRN
jgi:hypothetical protein